MAKMFYNLEEVAQVLGLDTDQVKQMVSDGKLQQFRDRDKLMFKRDQVDKLAAAGGSLPAEESGEISLEDTAETPVGETDALTLESSGPAAGQSGSSISLELEDTSASLKNDDTDALPAITEESAKEGTGSSMGIVMEDTGIKVTPPTHKEDSGPLELDLEETGGPVPAKKPPSKSATGMSIFESGDSGAGTDAMAKTQIARAIGGGDEPLAVEPDEDLALESVGSGSGLLDLTRETDDTSLGAVELLEDEGQETGLEGTAAGSSAGTAAGASSAGTIGEALPGSATGVFESGGTEVEGEAPESLEEGAEGEAEGEVGEEEAEEFAPLVSGSAAAEAWDPVGDAWSGATLLGVFAVLVVTTIVAFGGLQGQVLMLTRKFVSGPNPMQTLWMYLGAMLGGLVVLLLAGFFIGRSRAGKKKRA